MRLADKSPEKEGTSTLKTRDSEDIFEPKIHFWGHGVKLLVSSIREPMRKFLKSLMFILEKGTFFFEQLFPVVARTWLELSFFCQESRFLAQKSDFCHTTPILINGPILA